ncbi:hypothetical protein Dda_3742 [Drechslerella dactyloides]|uniref:HIT-type domain-containing protein n=1 Tax=Drechslerella dactyloides TaxID=74499 RepID=A0AAD6IZB7_DREDA|nr:hypothetical protein Dda_3742 [Drechslerella dactyloides]
MSVELLPNTAAGRGSSGGSSWYYSSAPPAQSVSALPKPDDLRARKAKTAALAISTASSSAITTDIDTPTAIPPSGFPLSSASTAAMGAHGPAAAHVYKLDPQTARRIAELEKVNWRDTSIKLDPSSSSSSAAGPSTSSDAKNRPKKPKSPNVRRILASAKTFHNHLSDDLASQELHTHPHSSKQQPIDPSTTPLGYVKCAAEPPTSTAERCRRAFCEICGYWGSVGCLRCGVRLCSAECQVTHREARCTRRF